jgi:hypothetical protein
VGQSQILGPIHSEEQFLAMTLGSQLTATDGTIVGDCSGSTVSISGSNINILDQPRFQVQLVDFCSVLEN